MRTNFGAAKKASTREPYRGGDAYARVLFYDYLRSVVYELRLDLQEYYQ